MKEKEKNDLTMILFAQSVAGSRNAKPMKRLEALHNDIVAVINGEKPTASWDLVRTKKASYPPHSSDLNLTFPCE